MMVMTIGSGDGDDGDSGDVELMMGMLVGAVDDVMVMIVIRALANIFPDMVWEFWPKFGREEPVKLATQKTLKTIMLGLGFDGKMPPP